MGSDKVLEPSAGHIEDSDGEGGDSILKPVIICQCTVPPLPSLLKRSHNILRNQSSTAGEGHVATEGVGHHEPRWSFVRAQDIGGITALLAT